MSTTHGARRQRLALALAAAASTAVHAATPTPDDLLALSLEELGDIEVTSVSRTRERLADAPASIYVIPGDLIRRAGVRTLPEALRLAPNLQVARVGAATYAISARGFNNSLGNKLLVLIDGRTVYTPLFSGVFWDQQDVVLEDVDRIEVISGPGATMWGANAVNGVINVITRAAGETRGALATAAIGGDGRDAVVRYGGTWGGVDYRVYAKRGRVESSEDAAGIPQGNQWDREQAGFRADWTAGADAYTVQGDGYRGESLPNAFGTLEVQGSNLLARWTREQSATSQTRLQVYADHTERDEPLTFRDDIRIVDVEFQHAFRHDAHAVVWGGGYRHAEDRVKPGLLARFVPAERDLDWINAFVQDEIALRDGLDATFGLKLDSNVYTGVEVLPSARVRWMPAADHMIWGAASRAVRAPARIDREFFFPANPPFAIRGGPQFESEVSNVLELGWRGQASRVAWSITAFHHDHDKLRSGQPAETGGGFFVENRSEGETYGIEAWATLQLASNWRVDAGWVELRQRLRQEPGALDPEGTTALGNDPETQWQLQSTWDFGAHGVFVRVRHVDALPAPVIPSYTTVDARWSWQPVDRWEFAVAGTDLADDAHAEFAAGALARTSEFGRTFALEARYRW